MGVVEALMSDHFVLRLQHPLLFPLLNGGISAKVLVLVDALCR